jgi:hypothetical protein
MRANRGDSFVVRSFLRNGHPGLRQVAARRTDQVKTTNLCFTALQTAVSKTFAGDTTTIRVVGNREGQSVESPYHFPDMDRLLGPADQAIEERSSPGTAAPEVSVPALPTIPGCTMLRPEDPDYAAHVPVYNARTQIAPALFAICSTASAVSGVFAWVKANNLPFVVRCGGHSYEGFPAAQA